MTEIRRRDVVRLNLARLGCQRAIERIDSLEAAELDRLEAKVALVDVRADLAIARRHLGSAAGALERIGKMAAEQL